MRLLITGGTGVLGRALRPLAEAAGHEIAMPRREELDLFHASAVADAMRDVDGVVHLATLPSGIYNVCRHGERVSAERFTKAAGWPPQP